MRTKLTQEIAHKIARQNDLELIRGLTPDMYDWYKSKGMWCKQYVCNDSGLINYLYRYNLVDTEKYSCPLWDNIK